VEVGGWSLNGKLRAFDLAKLPVFLTIIVGLILLAITKMENNEKVILRLDENLKMKKENKILLELDHVCFE
jgi:hypothetical protein